MKSKKGIEAAVKAMQQIRDAAKRLAEQAKAEVDKKRNGTRT